MALIFPRFCSPLSLLRVRPSESGRAPLLRLQSIVFACLGLAACSASGCQGGEPTPLYPSGGASSGTGGTVDGVGGSVGSGGADQGVGGMASGGDGAGGGELGTGGANLGPACAEGLSLCDDFESETIDTALWTVGKNNDNVVEISSEFAARGSKSLHIHTENGYGYVKNTGAFPVPNNDYFGRMFLRVARYSPVDWAHWTVAEAAGTGNDSMIRVGGQYLSDEDENRYGVGSDGGPTGDWTRHDSDPDGHPGEPKVGEWVCLEWEHKGSTNETH